MIDNTPLYNSRILKSYVEYLNRYFPNIDITPLLKYADIEAYQLDDEGHWLTQEQSDRFHSIISKTTQDPDIARKVGRFSATSRASGAVGQYLLGLINPKTAYALLEKINARLSRGSVLKIKPIGADKIEVKAVLQPGVAEKPYQCLNRLGTMESVAKLFTNNFASIEHPVCIHKGGDYCLYIVTWEKTRALVWKRIRNYSFIVGFIFCVISLGFLNPVHWDKLILLYILMSMCFTLYTGHLEKKELLANIHNQGDAADLLLDQINKRYNEALLIQEIGQASSMIPEVDKLLGFIMKSMERRLDFDRGIIMLANKQKDCLVYTVSYGYNPKDENYLKNIKFHLNNPLSKGMAVEAFRKQKPILINDTSDIENDLSPKSLDFVHAMGSQAFICVPIVDKGESMGVMIVDNMQSKKPLSQTEMSLLNGIAPQIGISINNAIAYQKIKESEERFRNLSDNSPDIIYQLDINQRLKYINPVCEEVLGQNWDELLDKNITDFIPEEERTAFDHIFQTIIVDKLTIRDKNFIMLNKEGVPRYITFTGAPDLDAEGKVMGVVGTLKDISILRSMENQLMQASKMEAVGTLTGGIAHDFNNIIQAIMGYNQLMISGRSGNEKDMLYLNSIGELIQRSRELVKQLMLFSGKVEPLSTVIKINDEIKSMQNLLMKSIPKMMEIKTNLDDKIFPISADSTQIGQIIMNLVINARDAMGDNGTINISTKNLSLQKKTTISGLNIPSGNYIEFSIADTGCGMEKDVVQRIFEPFFTTKKAGKGTGLGLAVVHGIVKKHDGFIYCESEPDKGTTFKIIFPASTSGKPLPKIEEQPQQSPYGTETILFVDDEPNLLEIGRETLSSCGYEVVTAENGEQALEVYNAQKDKISLVIMDLNMPGMGGKRCLIDLLTINNNAKILMTSGYSSSPQTKDLIKAGAAGFINKPYKPDELLLLMRRILDYPASL